MLRKIRRQLPGADLLYVADSGYAPYGDRPEQYVIDRSITVADFLVGQGADIIVVACNTATAVAVGRLRQRLTVPVVGIEPAVKPAAALTRSGVVGVLATPRTLATSRFDQLVTEYAGETRVLQQPCAGLADQVERGDLDSEQTRSLVARFVQPLVEEGADVLALGCTHYSFVKPLITELTAGRDITLLDPAPAVARQVVRRLQEAGVVATRAHGRERFWTSGDLKSVGDRIAQLWGERIALEPLTAGPKGPALQVMD